MAEAKLEKVKLPFPVTVNGVRFEGNVEVEKDTADALRDIVAGVKAEKETNKQLQADAVPAE